jgi:Holliday junction resolvase RusA-like endonuclease
LIRFTVPGKPCAKQSVRFTRSGHRYQPEDVLAYHDKIGWYARSAAPGVLLDGPVAVEIVASFLTPRSWSKKKIAAAAWHIGRIDVDNLAKALGDGLKGVLIKDDGQIARLVIEKRWSAEREGLDVTVTALEA